MPIALCLREITTPPANSINPALAIMPHSDSVGTPSATGRTSDLSDQRKYRFFID